MALTSKVPEKKWTLASNGLSDGAELLVLKQPDGQTLCMYAPGRKPYQDTWHSYFNGFPKQEFSSREKCIINAEWVARQKLEVVPYPHARKAMA